MHIILIGNYKKDQQESMLRFADMLYRGYSKEGIDTTIWHPVIFFGYLFSDTSHGIAKWFGYIDKWLIFPVVLKLRLWTSEKTRSAHFHISDHANAPYLPHLPRNRTVITCHDVIAIKSSLGSMDTEVKVSRFGYYLQKWILKNLKKAIKIASVSICTKEQLTALIGNKPGIQHKVIYNCFTATFTRMHYAEAIVKLKEAGISINKDFILHVGSAHPRKNRKMLLDMVAAAGEKWNGLICFAGEPVDHDLKEHADSLQLLSRVISIEKPTHDTLDALYSACYAFVFPSFSEGFGLPVIEAQACGAPVIVSNISPLPEVAGDGGLYGDPKSDKQFAAALISLSEEKVRKKQIENGYRNIRRFSNEEVIDSYIELHQGRRPVRTGAPPVVDLNLTV